MACMYVCMYYVNMILKQQMLQVCMYACLCIYYVLMCLFMHVYVFIMY